jgi:hypothetical protein
MVHIHVTWPRKKFPKEKKPKQEPVWTEQDLEITALLTGEAVLKDHEEKK